MNYFEDKVAWAEFRQDWETAKVEKPFPLPDGDYEGEIKSVEMRVNGNGKRFFRFGFQSGGGRAYRDCWAYNVESTGKFMEQLAAFGVTDPAEIERGDLIGKRVRFGVRNTPDDRKPDPSTVTYFRSISPPPQSKPPEQDEFEGTGDKAPF